MYDSAVTYLSCNLPKTSNCVPWPGSVSIGSLVLSLDGNWYSKFLPELMLAVHVLHPFSICFFFPGHQNMLLSLSIFADPGCPKCSASTTALFGLSRITILSAANNRTNRSVISLKTEKNRLEFYHFGCCGLLF